MASPWQYALTVGPLGFYLWVLALWQSDRHPRVVRGLVDFALLAFGVGGLLAFGPFGQLAVRMLSRKPDLLDRMVLLSGLGLWASVLAHRSLRRLVVYQVDPESLIGTLAAVLSRTEGRFVRTLGGFEDLNTPRGLRIDFTRPLRCAVVEAYGRDPEGLIADLRPRLRDRLRGTTNGPSSVALALYGCSILVMLVPLLGLFLTQPRAREAFRVLLERLRGV